MWGKDEDMPEEVVKTLTTVHVLKTETAIVDTFTVDGTVRDAATCAVAFRNHPQAVWDRECLQLMLLDGNHIPVGVEMLAIGGTESVALDLQVLVRAACMDTRTQCAVLCHNHLTTRDPPQPSPEDLKLSVRAYRALRYVDVALHDHIIVTPTSFYSMREGDDLKDIAPDDELREAVEAAISHIMGDAPRIAVHMLEKPATITASDDDDEPFKH